MSLEDPSEEVRIPDTELADAIHKALRLDEGELIGVTAMRELTELRAGDRREIADLTGLEHATQLEYLILSGTGVSDVSALANLTNLETLHLIGTNVLDISALANLTNLEGLNLSRTNVSDISALANLTNLEGLYLLNTNVSDISALANLTKLKWLVLENTGVSDVSALANLTNLEVLHLDLTNVSDISALANLPNLKELQLYFCPLSHASYHTHVPALQAKGIRVKVEDQWIETKFDKQGSIYIPDANLAAAIRRKLGLDEGAPITLLHMRNLRGSFSVAHAKVADLTGLQHAINLTRLDLSETNVSDISALANLTKLWQLNISYNPAVSDISALANLTNLTWLKLNSTNVSDISALANLTKLKWLKLRETNVWDVSAVANLPQLKELNLDDCPLSHASLHTHIPALQAKGITVSFTLPVGGCTTLLPEDLDPLRPVRIERSAPKKKIVSEGNIEARGSVKFAPVQDRVRSRAWAYYDTVFGKKYGNLDTVVITVRFLNGTFQHKKDIMVAAQQWASHGNVAFKFVHSGKPYYVAYENLDGSDPLVLSLESFQGGASDVRIYIEYDEEKRGIWWSMIGNDAQYVTDPEMTMHLTSDFTTGVVLHEFGHALGLAHEHLSPKFTELVEWAYEGEALYAAFANFIAFRSEEGYNYAEAKALAAEGKPRALREVKEKLHRNMLDTVEVGEGAEFDPDSIMTYGLSPSLLKARPDAPDPDLANRIAATGVPSNSELSWKDIDLLHHIYGRAIRRAKVSGDISIEGVDVEIIFKDETISASKSVPETVLADFGIFIQSDSLNPAAVFKWGGECRVEVYLSHRGVFDDHIEMAVSAFLFEGTTENTTDLEDMSCIAFEVPFGTSVQGTLTLSNGWDLSAAAVIDLRANECDRVDIDVTESTLSFRGDVLGGGDWAEVTFSLSAERVLFGDVESLLAAAAPAAAAVKQRPSQEISDVNGDGQVTVADLVLVSNHIGQTNPSDSRVDLNADGIVTIVDLVQVAQHLGSSTDSAAPAHIVAPKGLAYETVEGWLAGARAADDGSRLFLQGITNLERLLLLIIPEETVLLHNYPNPFNPETWIPYHLAEAAEVTLTIYAVDGTVVRTLALGHQSAGFYQSRSRAAYWDGRNAQGEPVASGVYFYTLRAGDFSATRKMVIRK